VPNCVDRLSESANPSRIFSRRCPAAAYRVRPDEESQPFSRSLIALAGEKPSFFDAGILIVSPVDGLRPSRAARSFTLNLPKPESDTSSLPAAALATAAKTVSTT
jgi:hypothetical protein